MKIAFVGKGGSGKSTVSWLLSEVLSLQRQVLAIDADYNMDLANNLGVDTASIVQKMNCAERDFYSYLGLKPNDYYVDLPVKTNLKSFYFSPPDIFTEKYIFSVPGRNSHLQLMVNGENHPDSLYGHRCSHAYISVLKYYLPLLQLKGDQAVLIDSVAGVDMVNFGLYLGVDAMVSVIENSFNSIHVYQQINRIAAEFDIPHFVVLNKVAPDILHKGMDLPADKILGRIPLDPAIGACSFSTLKKTTLDALLSIVASLEQLSFNPQKQWARHMTWHEKYQRQLDQNNHNPFAFLQKKNLS